MLINCDFAASDSPLSTNDCAAAHQSKVHDDESFGLTVPKALSLKLPVAIR